ncbi:hypothetical protein ABD87_23035 [Lysinibacillus sphaericus]|uniref:hypothetical protein n=1 Tax=Lysinibacillus sphaericus TaxID=1421 RepID=UPI0018CD1530|nr:hypothetical protein [Lysinibacillus sphaericus]MBG9732302.1 hypothetical protein [Lysinibacillus sphaericus]
MESNKKVDNEQAIENFKEEIVGIVLCCVIGLFLLGLFLTFHFAVQYPFLATFYIKDMTFLEKISHTKEIVVLQILSILAWELLYIIVVVAIAWYVRIQERISNLRTVKEHFKL